MIRGVCPGFLCCSRVFAPWDNIATDAKAVKTQIWIAVSVYDVASSLRAVNAYRDLKYFTLRYLRDEILRRGANSEDRIDANSFKKRLCAGAASDHESEA
jgi:hypothetical protein